MSCAAFSEASDPAAGEGGSADGPVGVNLDGGFDPDAGDAGTCHDLSKATLFQATASPGSSVTVVADGLEVVYAGPPAATAGPVPVPAPAPGGTPDASPPVDAGGPPAVESTAMWRLAFPAPAGSRGARITVDAVIQMIPPTTTWYAGFAGLVNGDLTAPDSTSSVKLTLADRLAGRAGLDVNTFPAGTATGPAQSRNVGALSLAGSATSQTVTAVLDVTWSTTPGQANVLAALDKQAQTLSTVTLKGAPAPSWTLVLGGTAAGNPALNIRYTRACVSVHP
jgi:hypothetical protein